MNSTDKSDAPQQPRSPLTLADLAGRLCRAHGAKIVCGRSGLRAFCKAEGERCDTEALMAYVASLNHNGAAPADALAAGAAQNNGHGAPVDAAPAAAADDAGEPDGDAQGPPRPSVDNFQLALFDRACAECDAVVAAVPGLLAETPIETFISSINGYRNNPSDPFTRDPPDLTEADIQKVVRAVAVAVKEQYKALPAVQGATAVVRAAGEGAGSAIVKPLTGVQADEVKAEMIKWRWTGRIAQGKLTDLQGDPGEGKSFIMVDVAARFTTGRAFPSDEITAEPGRVILFSAEDGKADTLRPRLEAAGADLALVTLFSVTEESLSLPDDLSRLKKTIEELDARLLILDPLDAFLSEDINTNNNTSIRRLLSKLTQLAEETGCAIITIRHLNKDQKTTKAMYRGGGSIGLNGAARSVLLAGTVPTSKDGLHALASVKMNLGQPVPALGYRFKEVELAEGIKTARLEWTDPIEGLTASELLREPEGERRGPQPEKRQAAEELVAQFLGDGKRHRSKDLDAAAREIGIKHWTLHAARKALGVRAARDGFGAEGDWVVWLPVGLPPNNSDSLQNPNKKAGSTKIRNSDSLKESPKESELFSTPERGAGAAPMETQEEAAEINRLAAADADEEDL